MSDENEFDLEGWMEEGLKGLRSCLPKEFVEHMRAARREQLLAIRSLLDAALERTEQKPRKKVSKIEVE